MMFLSDDELIDVFLSFGFMAFKSGHHSLWYRPGPGLRFLSLDPQEGIGVEVTQRDGETVRKLLGRQQLRVKKVFSVVLHLLSLLGGFTEKRTFVRTFLWITSKVTLLGAQNISLIIITDISLMYNIALII